LDWKKWILNGILDDYRIDGDNEPSSSGSANATIQAVKTLLPLIASVRTLGLLAATWFGPWGKADTTVQSVAPKSEEISTMLKMYEVV